MKLFKTIFLSLFFIFQLNIVFAQDYHRIDSLNQELKKATDDTTRINIFNNLAFAYVQNIDSAFLFSDSALSIANNRGYRMKILESHFVQGRLYYYKLNYNKALSNYFLTLRIAEELNLPRKIAKAEMDIGNTYKDMGNYEKAHQFYAKALKLDRQFNDEDAIAGVLNNIGLIYWKQDKYETALDYFQQSLIIKEKLGDKVGLAGSYNNLGVIYYMMKNKQKAVEYWEKSYKIWDELNDKSGIVEALNNLGAVYSELKKYDLSIQYLKKSLEIKEQIKDKTSIAMTCGNLGEVYMAKKDFDQAKLYFERAHQIAIEVNNKDELSSSYLSLSAFYVQIKDYKNALENALVGLDLAKNTGVLLKQKTAYALLSEIYENQGDLKKALEYYKLTYEINDSIYQMNSSEKIAEMQNKYETDKKQQEIELLNKEKKIQEKEIQKQQLLKNTFIISSILILVIAFILFNRYRLKKKASDELTYRNMVIEQQKEELVAQKDQLSSINFDLSRKNVLITDSINYAKKIQEAILPSHTYINQHFKEIFILFRPKDIVSGDFYWCYVDGNKTYIAIADCTGHGVPGAFMSMIGNTLLNEVVIEDKHRLPSEILEKLHSRMLHVFDQHESVNSTQFDGMDMSICLLDRDTNTIQVSTANQSVYIVDNDEIITVDGEIYAIGGGLGSKTNLKFNNHIFENKPGMMIYMTTDGFQDQFGGNSNQKFMVSNLKNLFLENYKLDIVSQGDTFKSTFEKWKGLNKQIDDVLLVGFRT